MNVSEFMTTDVECVNAFTSLAAAVESLWKADCGVLPVVNGDRRVVGMISDRDIAIALGTRHQLAADVTVGEVMSGAVFSCLRDDEVSYAIDLMKKRKVRRLPVLDDEGGLVGIISIADIAGACGPGGPKASKLTYETLAQLMRIICQHQKQAPSAVRKVG